MVKRKSPTRHKVRSHTRQGKLIKSFKRGSGEPHRRTGKFVVGRQTDSAHQPQSTVVSISDKPNSWWNLYGTYGQPDNVRVLYDPKLDKEASTTHKGIRLGKKFFDIQDRYPDESSYVLIHEVGHDLDNKTPGLVSENYDILDKEVFEYHDNPWESFAASFAAYVLEPEELKLRYPELYQFHRKTELERPIHYELAQKIKDREVTVT